LSDVEKTVRDFYDNFGWQNSTGKSGEELLFRRFSKHFYAYQGLVDRRTINCFSGLTGKLLIAGGGDLPGAHTKIARHFSSICCLDISQKALDISKEILGDREEYVLASILDIPKPANFFDAAFCAHVVYHIDKQLQSKAIRELVRVIRPGGRAVIIYWNPHSLPESILRLKSRLASQVLLIRRLKNGSGIITEGGPPLYFYAQPLEWWNQFRDECDVDFIPWSVMSADQERRLFINGWRAWSVYRFCSWYEKHYPKSAIKYWSYSVIILKKN
jgi:SAM-dependent methyltransferase